MIKIVLHNIRSLYNVGSIFRTCDGLGVDEVILSGYTPTPPRPNDDRPPHVRHKVAAQLHKTALGAEQTTTWRFAPDVTAAVQEHRQLGFAIIALEQAEGSVLLPDFTAPTGDLLVLLGEEVHGLPLHIIDQADTVLEIPMPGQKESFNVSVAAGIALYALIFGKKD